ncbi:MAG: Hsp20/alpha crystallin family protein [Labilithrix sp.]|nr:Hsp20/alpha crystallin family protein [Labilithrix sp.]MCW5813238.1 Hsp20/alpha crystallin family protein [Labilithrix sp.]
MERKQNQGIQRASEGTPQRAMSPFTTVRRMMEDMDRIFGGWGGGLSSWDEREDMARAWHPQVEVFQRGEDLVVRADLPGLESKDVDVELDDDGITIKGERRAEHEETKEGIFHSERSYGSFRRRIPLPSGIVASDCDALFQNGVLEVTLKLPKIASHKVQIRGNGEPH